MVCGPDETLVFTLPDEVLIRIFHYFVDKDHSPVELCHVCRLWRHLTLATSNLWNLINLRSVGRAKHHLALAQQQPLVVIWEAHDIRARPKLNDYEWIFSQASRFLHLDLKLHIDDIVAISKRWNSELSQLLSLKIIGDTTLFYSSRFAYMTQLRVLSFSTIRLSATDLGETLRCYPLLETLEFYCVTFYPNMNGPDSRGPIELPHLTSCTMSSLDVGAQRYLMATISLPKRCILHNTYRAVDCRKKYWRGLWQSSYSFRMDSTFDPIRIAELYLHSSSIVFIGIPQNSQCTFELTVDTTHAFSADVRPWNDIMSRFDLNSITRLQLDADSTVFQVEYADRDASPIRLLELTLARARELVIKVRTLEMLVRVHNWVQDVAYIKPLKLETLVLQDMNLNTRSAVGRANAQAIPTLVSQVRFENVFRLVLRDCETSAEALDILRAALPTRVSVECTK